MFIHIHKYKILLLFAVNTSQSCATTSNNMVKKIMLLKGEEKERHTLRCRADWFHIAEGFGRRLVDLTIMD